MNCRICSNNITGSALYLGKQPIANRYLKQKNDLQVFYPLSLIACESCGVIQLYKPIPYDQLASPYDWLKYNEPELHLDDALQKVMQLPNIDVNSKIFGISYKDDSFLKRLQEQGLKNVYRLFPDSDLHLVNNRAGVETVQAYITESAINAIIEKRGKADLLIARHILEHAHEPIYFMKQLLNLVKDEGYLIFEVPDESRAFDLCEVMVAWEEHITYFTPTTFTNFFNLFSCKILENFTYPYPFENSLVVFAKKKENFREPSIDKLQLISELERFKKFSNAIKRNKKFYQDCLGYIKKKYGTIACFGAGHLTTKFINFYELSPYIDFIADDNLNKQGHYMPGSALSILPSYELVKRNVKLCLIGVNPNIEDIILEKNTNFIKNGGKFLSIYQSSELALIHG